MGGAVSQSSTFPGEPIVVWCLADSRAGHRRQIEGLVTQLARRRAVCSHWIDVTSATRTQKLEGVLRGTFDVGHDLPDPHMIVGAGHATHLPALAARRARGGRAIVLMRPTLPMRLFDLCLVPAHDLHSFLGRQRGSHVVPTQGVLNPFDRSELADPAAALMLIGGPSRHHGWCDDEMIQQLQEIRMLSPTTVCWTLSTSRRTPHAFVQRARQEFRDNAQLASMEIVPFENTGPGWLADALSRSQTVFVSEDSISMVYEALTVGADVGLLHVLRW